MSDPRRHHINPEHVLRRFADKNDRVRVRTRADLTQGFTTSVAKVAVERDFYAVETPGGLSQAVEKKLLWKIENAAAPAFDRLIGGVLTPDDRAAIAAFIAAQYLRGWDRREQFSAIAVHFGKLITMNTTRASLRRYFREVEGREAKEDEITRYMAFASDPTRYKVVPHRNELVRSMLEMLPGIANLVFARRWQLLQTDEPSLVTSDSPVTLWSHRRERAFGVGFGTASEIAFPVDRRHALLLTYAENPQPETMHRIDRRAVSILNTRTAASACKWVIHHPGDDPPMEKNLPPPQPKFTISEPFRVVPDGA